MSVHADPLHKIAILGPGLMGGSLLLAAQERQLAREIAVWDRDEEGLEKIRRTGRPCTLHTNILTAVEQAELVILCVPIGVMGSVLEPALPGLSAQTVVTDVGSVKSRVVTELETLIGPRALWIGGHPMAGRELAGFEAAKADLFQGATTILTPTALTNPRAQTRVTKFWQDLGAQVLEMSPQTHDHLVADISHLPHLVAAALIQSVDSESLPLAGSGFRDTTRVASGPAEMWQEILLANGSALGFSLDKLIQLLQVTRRALADNDRPYLENLLTSANQIRQRIVKS